MTREHARLICWWGGDEDEADRMARHVSTALRAGRTDLPDPAVAGPEATVRGAIVADDSAQGADRVARARAVPVRARPIALLFAGQGAQYPRMAAGLYRHDPVFTAAADTVLDQFPDRVRRAWLADPATDPAEFDDMAVAQPLLFAIGHALGRMVLGWGVSPAVLVGYSVGEFVAATLAGVFDPDSATEVLSERFGQLEAAPPGGMLAVLAPPEELTDVLGEGVAVGAVNAPRQTVLAGPDGALDAAAARLRARDITCRRVRARQPFHSPVVEPQCRASVPALAQVPLAAPTIPIRSSYTTARITRPEALDPEFWAMQPARPVLFSATLDALLERDHLLVDVGPGQSLTSLTKLHPRVRGGASTVVPLLPATAAGGPAADRAAVLAVRGRMWAEGLPLGGLPLAV